MDGHKNYYERHALDAPAMAFLVPASEQFNVQRTRKIHTISNRVFYQ